MVVYIANSREERVNGYIHSHERQPADLNLLHLLGTVIAQKVVIVLYSENKIPAKFLQGIEDHSLSRNPTSLHSGPLQPPLPSPRSHENHQPFDRSYNLCRQKSSRSTVFKYDERFPGAQNTSKSRHDIRNISLTPIQDNEIPTGHAVDLMHTCITGIAKKYFNMSIP